MGITSAVRRLTGDRRDTASFGAATLGVLLLVGAALGTGVARTAVDVSDGLTWLPDSPRGEVVQVNPASGRPETRLQVSGGDALLEITQKDDLLVVLDRRTGQVTVLDLATLLASGRRQTAPGPVTKVLVSDGRIYVVDRKAGTITNADPVTLVDVGTPWRAGQPLADVVADDAGTVWAADQKGTLHELAWAEDEFTERSGERVDGAGPGTVLVPHAAGVTLFGLDGGVVVQVGTDQDVSATTARLTGEVLAALTSPAGLVPASVPGEALVVMVAGDRLARVDVGALGCANPGRPVVFRDRVYVPCRGAAKVVVLDRAGKRGGPDVRTTGDGDPELVSDDGRLFISAPGAERGVIVDSDGRTRPVVIRSPEVPVVDPDRPPTQDVPTPPRPSPRPDEPDEPDGGTQARPPSTPSPGAGQPGAQGKPPGAPTGVSVLLGARSADELNLNVSWGAPADNGERITGYTVVASGDFAGGSRAASTTGTSTRLTIPCAGSTFCDGGRVDVAVTAANRNGSGTAGTGSWTVPPQQGGPTTEPTTPPTTPPTGAPTTQPTTTTTVPPPPPTTTEPPPPPPTTVDPPPPAPVPTAGATVIVGSSAPNGQTDNTRRLSLSPPGDWASHDGRCEVVNTTQGYSTTIACSAGSVDVTVETGPNRFVVRAHARDGSRSVDSAGRSVQGPREPMCGQYVCLSGDKIVDLSPTAQPVRFGQAGAGVGLLVIALWLKFGRRKDES